VTFDSNYEVFLADTIESQETNYNLRYQVYCEETNFEDPQRFKNQMEFDGHDFSSVHFVVRSNKTREWLGAIRLIINKSHMLPSYIELPDDKFDKSKFKELEENSEKRITAEVSRLCIVKKYRTSLKYNCSVSSANNIVAINRHSQSEIMMGLLRAVCTYCLKNNINILLFTVAKSLARILKKLGFNITRIGQECDYHGRRTPFYSHIPTLFEKFPEDPKALHSMFTDHKKAYQFYSHYFGADKIINHQRKQSIPTGSDLSVITG